MFEYDQDDFRAATREDAAELAMLHTPAELLKFMEGRCGPSLFRKATVRLLARIWEHHRDLVGIVRRVERETMHVARVGGDT